MKKKFIINLIFIFSLYAAVFSSLIFIKAAFAISGRNGREANAIKWESIASAIKKNKIEKKYFLLHFYFPTCVYCIKMEKHVFNHKSLINYINKHFYPVMIDIYGNKKNLYFNGEYLSGKQLASKFDITGTPTEVYFNSSYKKIFKLYGYWKKADFLLISEWIASGKYKTESLRKFSRNFH